MQKYLITGFSGFVSRQFLDFLEQSNIQCFVHGVDLQIPEFDYNSFLNVKCIFSKIDLLDAVSVENLLYNFQPDYILHFASFSSVRYSWQNPVQSFANNTNIFLVLIDKVRLLKLNCRILSVGSSEEYGNFSPDELPLKETSPLNPISPYAVARVAQENLSKVYIDGFGLDIIMTRSFNHIGPYQKEIFAVPSFIKQLVEIKNNMRSNNLQVGNISLIRDFIDVRDVVRAYYLLLQNGKKGEIYNICSGKGNSLETIIQNIISILNIQVNISVNDNLIRPNDNQIIIGSNAKIFSHIGWKPEISMDKSLKDLITYWEKLLLV